MAQFDSKLTLTLAILFVVGGFIGLATSGSVMSMVGGLLFGGLIGFASQKIASPKERIFGYKLAIVGCFLATCFMGWRFYLTGKVFPAGVFSVLSFGVTAWNALQLNKMH